MVVIFVFISHYSSRSFFFFFNGTAPPELYTLSLHDALPICSGVARAITPSARRRRPCFGYWRSIASQLVLTKSHADRKSTRLNSSHITISYAVFCLKKKKKKKNPNPTTKPPRRSENQCQITN